MLKSTDVKKLITQLIQIEADIVILEYLLSYDETDTPKEVKDSLPVTAERIKSEFQKVMIPLSAILAQCLPNS